MGVRIDRRTAVLGVAAALLAPRRARASTLADLSGTDAAAGLKEALSQGASQAVELLGRTDGFLAHPTLRIPLPDGMRRVERVLRATGQGAQVDELVVAMNRAAEAAVPEARDLLVGAVRKMTVADAKSVLTGGDDAATRYFRDATSADLARRFEPIVAKATARVSLARRYDRIASQAQSFGLVKVEDASVDRYVTRKALDGLFATIAEQERAIRQNPAAAAGSLARRVFAVLGR